MSFQPSPAQSGPLSDVLRVVLDQSDRSLSTYRNDPGRILEDANGERRIQQGGYGDRQLYELVQNGADELRDRDTPGRVAVVLTQNHLYCANEGNPLSADGAETILRMSVSKKRGGQIGRFGVGVKSVLSITDTPQFFSVTGSFGFDREWSARLIHEVHPQAKETPVLRMARPLDLARELREDHVLNDLFSRGAVTVVRLPLLPSAAARLGRDLRAFPREFPLFSPHVGTIDLEDRRENARFRRSLSGTREGTVHTLLVSDNDGPPERETWRVFTVPYSPTAKTREASGELHDRPVIDISWAVPESRRELGAFWAYFPTHYPMTLRGILNAAWKTNEDRQHLVDGTPLNDELLGAAAGLVAASLPALTDPADPARHLAHLPGRYKERRNWADGHVIQGVWREAAARPSLPDQDGVLRKPSALRVHPEELRPEWLDLWASHPARPAAWVHRSVETDRDRRGKLGHILEAAHHERATVQEWLEALVIDGTPAASACALRILAAMIRGNSPYVPEARQARILLTEAHGLVAPRPNTVFRRVLDDSLPNEMVYVHPEIATVRELSADLDTIGIHEADALGRFEAVVDQGFARYGESSWEEFWKLSRRAGAGQSIRILNERVPHPTGVLKVRTLAGAFSSIESCLLPGPVVPADGSRDAALAVDPRFHRDDLLVLRDLGARSGPDVDQDPAGEPWFESYAEAMHKAYCATLPASSARPNRATMRMQGASPAGPLGFLTRLSEEGRADFVAAMPDRGMVRNWTRQVGKQSRTQEPAPSPLRWMVTRYGYARTDRELLPLRECVGPQLSPYAAVLPVARLSPAQADALEMPGTLDKVPQRVWNTVHARIAVSEDDAFLGNAYTLLTRADAGFPEGVETRCRIGTEWGHRPDTDIAVTSVREEYDGLVRESVPALLVDTPEDAELLRERWDMCSPGDKITKELSHASEAEPELLLNRFPSLRLRTDLATADAWFQSCTRLEEIIRTDHNYRPVALKSALDGRVALISHPEDELEILHESSKVFGWRLSRAECRQVIALQEQQRANEKLQRVVHAESVTDKLLLLIGEEALRTGLPPGLWEDELHVSGKEPDGRRIAELAYNSEKDGVLRHYAKAIASRWAEAPNSYGGDTAARQFVNRLGFPEAFAGARPISPPAMEQVAGPVDFPRLHDYQEQLAQNLFYLLTDPDPKRAMLCMPTGSGKTRVAAEAVIRAIKHRRPTGPILWIAQSEELCEQAVQSWKFVWSKVGAEREALSISRLWGANSATDIRSTVHLVVAVDAKLERHLDTEAYAWLREASAVIVDEAHTSLSRRYTRLFELLGISRNNRTERPLVGLTATPFRSTNEDETQRLVQRYGRSRLDKGVLDPDPYPQLQDMKVLARVEQRVLRGATVTMSASELSKVDTFGALPATVEDRLAFDHERNRMLVDEIASLPADWPVLLFATSVAHAKVIAAKLNGMGVSADSIDSATPTATRRKRVDDFRENRIRVLANYGVLTQGFDAPATRVVVVSRPTYSPNVYQQMIGRGLRGPANGGKDTCLILNVDDNIENYGHKLAFTEFEHLWERK
ncbi:DEAD/DEAH box helicase family protein [Streptomyces virginiae]|uniref:DEAD/DEAH box helicase n=1 Tax=Streptomyces virginiae TaxID=1961 RepID=UPI002259915F|nr:DEAD/DEAH box helicase family protein [Streptomyces virginiae]MCX4719641.1 DEAD/DEAH box helicase family protein [Streptomyces virginiae]